MLAHAGVGHTEHWLVQGLLEDQLHGLGKLLLGVNDEIIELGHEDVELLRTELVEDGPDLLAQDLQVILLSPGLLLASRFPGVLPRLPELDLLSLECDHLGWPLPVALLPPAVSSPVRDKHSPFSRLENSESLMPLSFIIESFNKCIDYLGVPLW